MKKFHLYIICPLLLLAISCKEDYNQLTTGYGDLEIHLSIDTAINDIALAQSRYLRISAPDINSIAIYAEGDNGNRREWKNIGEFEQSHKKIPVDNYTFRASSGTTGREGYISPYFASECKEAVKDNQLSEITLDCKVASTIITKSVSIDNPAISGLTIRVKSSNGKYVELSSDDKPAMINPGKIRGEVTITDNSGRKVTLQPIEISNASQAEHYTITATTPGDGSNTVCFAYDAQTAESPVIITVDDALFTTTSPTFTTQGFGNGNTLNITENETVESPLTCEATVPGGLQHLYLSIKSDAPDNKFNICEADMAEGIPAELAGLVSAEGNSVGSELATIDFTQLISSLPAYNGEACTYEIILQAQDAQGRVGDTPCVMTVAVNPVNISIMQPDDIGFEAKEAVLTVAYNGDSLNDIVLQYETSGDNWLPLEMKQTVNNGDGTFSVTTLIPEELHVLKIRAEYKNGLARSETVIMRRVIPEYGVAFNQENIWPSKADIIITGENAEKVIKYISVFIREKDGNMHPAVMETVPAERRITISTLMPSTEYTIVVSTSKSNEKYLNFTTEKAIELPNGGFEDNITETISIPMINCGGRYSNRNSWMPTYNTTEIKVSEAKDWASVNAKTCSEHAKTANTWFKVPTTEIIKSAYEGQNAVLLRNAAWDLNGIEPPRDTRTDDVYYSRNVPQIANRSAGKIFLGNYGFSSDGTESYNEGIGFTSRPSAISGYYYYRQDVSDLDETGIVIIQLINESDGTETMIGEGRGELKASTSFTRFAIPIVYTVRNKQATKLKLMVSSSCYASYNQAEETRRIKTTAHLEKGVSTGAELVVDNLQLLYE